MKKIRALLMALLLLAGLGLIAPAGAQAGPYCGITWGSLAKSAGGMSTAPVTNVRTGQQTCYDRLVVDLQGKAKGFTVSYVTQVRQIASGQVVPLRGGAFLNIVVNDPAYRADGTASYTPANPRELSNVSGYSAFRQVAFAGSFEGKTSIGLGVRARLPFRAFILDGPGGGSRLVVDVAHYW